MVHKILLKRSEHIRFKTVAPHSVIVVTYRISHNWDCSKPVPPTFRIYIIASGMCIRGKIQISYPWKYLISKSVLKRCYVLSFVYHAFVFIKHVEHFHQKFLYFNFHFRMNSLPFILIPCHTNSFYTFFFFREAFKKTLRCWVIVMQSAK